MIDKRDVWDLAPDSLKLAIFPVLVQAVYNAMVTLSSLSGDRLNISDGEASATLWDLRNVNTALYDIGVKPTYPKRVSEDRDVSLYHFSTSSCEAVIDEFANAIKERKEIWYMEQNDAKDEKIRKLERKLMKAKFHLHCWKKFGHDVEEKEKDDDES